MTLDSKREHRRKKRVEHATTPGNFTQRLIEIPFNTKLKAMQWLMEWVESGDPKAVYYALDKAVAQTPPLQVGIMPLTIEPIKGDVSHAEATAFIAEAVNLAIKGQIPWEGIPKITEPLKDMFAINEDREHKNAVLGRLSEK